MELVEVPVSWTDTTVVKVKKKGLSRQEMRQRIQLANTKLVEAQLIDLYTDNLADKSVYVFWHPRVWTSDQ